MNQHLSIEVMQKLENQPEQSQRTLSKACGVSLGTIHYCLDALIKKRYARAKNFKNEQNKLAFAYILTPSGLNQKRELTGAFLKRKQLEYVAFQLEINAREEDLKQ